MDRGDVLLVGLPESSQREEKGDRPAIAVQTNVANSPMLMIVPVTSSLKVCSCALALLSVKSAKTQRRTYLLFISN